MASPSSSLSPSSASALLREWSVCTLASGTAGGVFGGLRGVLLGGHATHLLAASFAVNALLLGGSFFGVRALAHEAAGGTVGALGASALAGAVVGGGAAARVLGVSAAPRAAAVYAAGAAAVQAIVDASASWRAREAQRITRERELLARLTPADAAAWERVCAAVRRRDLAKAEADLTDVEAFAARVKRARGADDAVVRAPSLEEFVAAASGEAVSPRPPPPPRSATASLSASPSSPRAALQSLADSSSGFFSWLPVSFDVAASDARRLEKARARLRDVEEALGVRTPEAHAAVADLARREKAAKAALGEADGER
jgi:hypothetical protein